MRTQHGFSATMGKWPRAIGLAVAMLGLVIGAPARGDLLVDFSYTGSNGNGILDAYGTGSFSFAGNLTTVNLSDLSSFDLSLQLVDKATSPPAQGTYTYGLSDLTSFAATVGSGPTLTSLSLATEFVSVTNETGPGHLSDESFNITSLGTGDAGTANPIESATAGTVTISSISQTTAVPEPSTAVVAAFSAVALLAYGWSRDRRELRRQAAA